MGLSGNAALLNSLPPDKVAADPSGQVPETPSPTPQQISSAAQSQQPPSIQQAAQQVTNAATQGTLQTPPPPRGGVRALLSNFLGGMGQAMMHHAGLPTPLEQQQKMSEIQLQGAQAREADSRAAFTNVQAGQYGKMVSVPLPNGQFMQVPFALAQKMMGPSVSGQYREDAAQTQANTKLLLGGFDPSTHAPLPIDQLPITQQSKVQLNTITAQLKSAQTELAKAGNDPSSPLFQQRQQRVNVLAGMLKAKFQENGIAQERLVPEYAKAGLQIGPDGSPQPLSANSNGGINYNLLSQNAQKTLQENEPVKQQIDDLMSRLETLTDSQGNPLKDNNQNAYLLPSRIGYMAGLAGDENTLAGDISKIELQRVVGAARVLKGSSRAVQALKLAMQHLPNTYTDSPQLMYQKLGTVKTALQDIEDAAVTYGSKSGITPTPPKNSKSGQNAPEPTANKSAYQVGRQVLIHGKPMTITTVHKDGSFDAR